MAKSKHSSPDENRLRISQVAQQAGVSKATVEYYILIGLIHPRRNAKTGRRSFGPDDVRRVQLIRKLNKSGYPLREIREIWLRKK